MLCLAVFTVFTILSGRCEAAGSLADKNPAKATSRFLWLTQVPSIIPPIFRHVAQRADADVLVVHWNNTPADGLDAKGTTWTTGRNLLLERGLAWQKRPRANGEIRNFDYFVFCDDDIEFHAEYLKVDRVRVLDADPVELFHQFLLMDRPVIGVGRYNNAMDGRKGVTSSMCPDAIVNAFDTRWMHHLLPYDPTFDKESVWISQAILCWRASVMFTGRVRQLGALRVYNGEHRPYARSGKVPTWGRPVELRVSETVDEKYRHCVSKMNPNPGIKPRRFWLRCHYDDTHGNITDDLAWERHRCSEKDRLSEPEYCRPFRPVLP